MEWNIKAFAYEFNRMKAKTVMLSEAEILVNFKGFWFLFITKTSD